MHRTLIVQLHDRALTHVQLHDKELTCLSIACTYPLNAKPVC